MYVICFISTEGFDDKKSAMPFHCFRKLLEKGTVDGCTAQIAYVLAYKLEVLKYCLKLNKGSFGCPSPAFMVMNLDTYNSLSPDLQKAVDDSREWTQQLTCDQSGNDDTDHSIFSQVAPK